MTIPPLSIAAPIRGALKSPWHDLGRVVLLGVAITVGLVGVAMHLALDLSGLDLEAGDAVVDDDLL